MKIVLENLSKWNHLWLVLFIIKKVFKILIGLSSQVSLRILHKIYKNSKNYRAHLCVLMIFIKNGIDYFKDKTLYFEMHIIIQNGISTLSFYIETFRVVKGHLCINFLYLFEWLVLDSSKWSIDWGNFFKMIGRSHWLSL